MESSPARGFKPEAVEGIRAYRDQKKQQLKDRISNPHRTPQTPSAPSQLPSPLSAVSAQPAGASSMAPDAQTKRPSLDGPRFSISSL